MQRKQVVNTEHPLLACLGENHPWLALASSDVLLWVRFIDPIEKLPES
jgi:hypothetical protein